MKIQLEPFETENGKLAYRLIDPLNRKREDFTKEEYEEIISAVWLLNVYLRGKG